MKTYNERDRNIHLLHRDFWKNNFSTQNLIRYKLQTYNNRRVTNEMLDDDGFWEEFKKSSTYRNIRRNSVYQQLLYHTRRKAYDLVRKDALGITESDPTV